MTLLSLSGERTIRASAAFDCVDDEVISASIDVVPDKAVRENGLMPVSLGQITVTNADGRVESSVYLTDEELERHIYELRSVLLVMRRARDIADIGWRKYRELVYQRQRDGEED